MESTHEPRPGDDAFNGFQMSLPENCVEYMLFIVSDQAVAQRTTLSSLETVRKMALRRLDELTKDYIWQREALRLETKIENGLVYLHGRTDYGDNVEDEWLIVYFLRQLSITFPNLWIRIFDSDGEFLLIEAAKVLPRWLSPEMDANRVWINSGQLRIIPLLPSPSPSPPNSSKTQQISLHEALSVIRTTPNILTHSPFIEAEAFYRLEKYPGQIDSSIHHALVTIPRKLAYILHERPKAVAPATEAFYLRDPVSLKPLLSPTPESLLFPQKDLVTVSVRLTKVLYAQLKSQHFDPPAVWREHFLQSAQLDELSLSETEEGRQALQKLKMLARLEMGMKLTTGFEILARGAEKSGNHVAREVALLLEDLAEDGEEAALPSDEEIKKWKDVEKENDDSWMDIDFADFEKELAGADGGGEQGQTQQQKQRDGVDGTATGEMPTFGDATTQTDLRKIVSRFEAFLNDETAGLDGAEIDEMDQDDDEQDSDIDTDDSEDEDKEVSFDEEQFSRMMREMMGIPTTMTTTGSETTITPSQKPDTTKGNKGKEKDEGMYMDEDEQEELEALMVQMKKELNSYGALQLDPQKAKTSKRALKGEIQREGSTSKGEATNQEMSKTTTADDESDDDDEEEEGEDDDVDLDYNLAKNLLESFKSQAGMAGPAGNLLGLMGIMLPCDEEDEDAPGGKS